MSRAVDTLTNTELEPLSPMFPGGPPRLGHPKRRSVLPMVLVCTLVVVASSVGAVALLRVQRQMGPPDSPTAGLEPELSPQPAVVAVAEFKAVAADKSSPTEPLSPPASAPSSTAPVADQPSAAKPSPGTGSEPPTAPTVSAPSAAAVAPRSPEPATAAPVPARPPVTTAPGIARVAEAPVEPTPEERYRDVVTRGVAAAERGALGEASRLFRQAVRLNPSDPDGWNSLGVVLARQGNIIGGMDALHQALQVDATFAPAHRNLGILLERQGRSREAIAHYRSFLFLVAENHPDRDAVRQRLAVPIRRVPTP